jgi:ABC-type transport system involved in cytochrome c biogenesis ATPase subunit
VRAVRNLSFQVEQGEIFGFLGPNGAGKTTTIRCMLDLIRPTSGTITIFGLDLRREPLAIHRRIGYLPGDVRLPGDLTAKKLLDHHSRLAGLEPVLLPMLMERFEVPLNRKLKGFSKGMRQMVAILQAFMCDPELVILDEPTSGLDPLGQRTFNEFQSGALLLHPRRAGDDQPAVVRYGEIPRAPDGRPPRRSSRPARLPAPRHIPLREKRTPSSLPCGEGREGVPFNLPGPMNNVTR